MAAPRPQHRLTNPVLLICDIQENFRPAIHQYDKVIATAQKLLKAATILHIPILSTTQSASALGPLCAELLPSLAPSATHDKTRFSMAIAPILAALPAGAEVAIVGIEAHICVAQTALDLRARGHVVYVVADGVSSGNREEVPVALARLRAEGVRVVTSEGWVYEVMGDAGVEGFRGVVAVVKEGREGTREGLRALCKI